MSDPQDGSSRSLGDLFDNLPTPASQLPEREVREEAAPGSRRALREAAERAAAADAPAPAATDESLFSVNPAAAASTEAESAPAPKDDPAEHPLDALFTPSTTPDPARKRRGKGCLIGLIVVLALVGGLVAGGAWVMNTYGDKINDMMGWGEPKDWEPGQAGGEAFVTIKQGDTGSPVSTALYEAKVTKTDRVFYDYLVKNDVEFTLFPGVYKLQQKMSAEEALKALENPENRMEDTVRIGEGGTVASSLQRITEGVGIPIEELKTAVADPSVYGVQAKTLEGWLFPAVYVFDPETTAQEIIQKMVDRTSKSLADAGVAPGDAQRVLTIASIIQREGHTADFDKVSRVIENRLAPANEETHGLLQMDSTAQYGYGLTHEGPVSSWPWKEVVGDQNAWNTYVHAGLPASPISNPSDAAIKAAQNPADGPWYYFVTVNLDTGKTVFSATYKEQQAAEAEYKRWCKDNPDRGCY